MYGVYWVDGWDYQAEEPAGGGCLLVGGLSLPLARLCQQASQLLAHLRHGPGLVAVLDREGRRAAPLVRTVPP